MKGVSVEKLEEIFKVYDEKRTGKIATNDMAKLIRSARLFPNEQDIDDLKKSVDPNRIGYFDMKSFVDVGMEFSYKQAQIDHKDELVKAFSFFDEDQNGFITETDLRKIMSAFGEPLNEEQTKEILKYAKAVNGKIYYREFAEMIINGESQQKS